MAHISTGVEYGLHCLLFLAGPSGPARPASARDLAEFQGVPAEFVAKLFTKLQKAGLVVAAEGARGGFRLAREPEAISVLDVVRAIDGDKSLFDCREIRGRCILFDGAAPTPTDVCSIHAVMLEAEARMNEALAAHTLAQIAARVAAKTPAGVPGEIARWFEDRATAPRRARGEGS